jgi:hypothetical protein
MQIVHTCSLALIFAEHMEIFFAKINSDSILPNLGVTYIFVNIPPPPRVRWHLALGGNMRKGKEKRGNMK